MHASFLELSSMPWNTQTPLGYAGEVLFGLLLSEAYLIGNGSILMLFVCICLHHKAFQVIFSIYWTGR